MTLVVIVGVLTGPTIVNCFNSPDGMGICLRGEMTNAGILPRSATAPVEAAAPAAAPESPTPAQPNAVAAKPAPDTTTSAASAPGNLVAATFGLLRAEPDGSVVIAGSGTPGSQVEVYADDALIGTADVEPSGDWVLVPDAPLPVGGLEITLGEAGKPGRATASFVVAINQDKSSEPLVVATTPGAASAILQGVDTAKPSPQVASAEPVQTSSAPVAPAIVAAPQTAAVAPVAPVASQPSPTATTSTTTSAAPAPVPETAVADPAPTPSTTDTSVPATPANEAPSAATPEISIATAEPLPTVSPPTIPTRPTSPPTIDAIEIEGDSTFFAGAGPEGGSIRLYVDDAFVADAKISDGRWLVEAGSVLKKPNQRVRVDLLQPGSAEVASRAEVNLAVELPQAVADAAVATPTPAASTPAPTTESTPAPVAASAPNPTPPTPAPSAPESPTSSTDAVATAVPAPTPATIAEAPAAAAPTATVPEPSAIASAPETSIPTMTAVAIGDPDAARFASGKAIIRRGDNLWTIAKRVYGEGIKYTTIYEANTGQIRDPDRIYPGQVFGLPQGNAN